MFGLFFISRSLSNIATFLYPAYRTFKALQTEDESDDKRWLSYWSVVGFLTMIEYYLEYFVSFLPFYWEIKILLMLWLIHPLGPLDGAKFVYSVYVQPLLASREKAIDQLLVDFGMGSLLEETEAANLTSSWEQQESLKTPETH